MLAAVATSLGLWWRHGLGLWRSVEDRSACRRGCNCWLEKEERVQECRDEATNYGPDPVDPEVREVLLHHLRPNARAGFMAAPVMRPPKMMSMVIVRPIRSGAIALGPRGSTAVPNATRTRKKVMMPSSSTPPNWVTPGPSAGTPRLTPMLLRPSSPRAGKINVRTAAPAIPPNNCATMYTAARTSLMLPVARMEIVTAGLKWPPDTAPRAPIISAMASPWASPTATRLPPSPRFCVAMTAPTPAVTSANGPRNSATAALARSRSSIPCPRRLRRSQQDALFSVRARLYQTRLCRSDSR